MASILLVQIAAKMVWFWGWDNHQIVVASQSWWLPDHGSGGIIEESVVF